jgi:NDP-sugar pyrophosphorylase family protein
LAQGLRYSGLEPKIVIHKAALVLAAGFGTRLRPYTEFMPKPLLPVAGIEPLFFGLWRAKCLGAKKFYVNAHYHHEQIDRFLKTVAEPVLGIQVQLLLENPILGTGGAIRNLIQHSKAKDFDELIVINGDTLLGLEDLGGNQDQALPQDSWCLVTPENSFLQKYKPLWVNEVGEYAGVGDLEHPKNNWQPNHFFGLHALNSEATALLRADNSPVVEQDLFRGIYRPILDSGLKVKAVSHNLKSGEFWFDMTNKEFFLEAQNQLINTVAKAGSCWKQALEARWKLEAKTIGNSWLIGNDPGCVDWGKSQFSIVVSPSKLNYPGHLGLDSSVLILEGKDRPLGNLFVRNSLLMSAEPKSVREADSHLENEIIFL